jgi:hypothetical protein
MATYKATVVPLAARGTVTKTPFVQFTTRDAPAPPPTGQRWPEGQPVRWP